MTPLDWFGYIVATTAGMAVTAVVAALLYVLWLTVRNWLEAGADTEG